MAPSSENDDDGNDGVSSDTITEETTAIPILPFEIVEEILSKLPVKFLMQLKSVCKSWKSLISDPNFAKKHLRVSTTRHHVLVTYDRDLISESFFVVYPFSSVFTLLTAAAATLIDFPRPNGKRFDSIVGSCHGIICFELDHNFALLWNPSIRKFIELPSLENPKQEYSYTAYGFGYVYDHFNDNYIYKVAAVNSYDESYDGFNDFNFKTQVKVYTFGTNSWRMIQDPPYCFPYDSFGRFVSGTINWSAYEVSSISPWLIVSLDLDKESYQVLMHPDYGFEIVIATTLAVLRDCLSIIVVSDTFTDVWLMDEYGNTESWTKLFRIPQSCIGDLESSVYIKPLYLSEDDQVLLECYYELQSECHVELAIYNARDSTYKITEIQNINESMVHEIYQETLIMPCS